MTRWAAAHRKLLTAIAGGAVTVLVTYYGTSAVWVQALILTATAAGVYGVPNKVASPADPFRPPSSTVKNHP